MSDYKLIKRYLGDLVVDGAIHHATGGFRTEVVSAEDLETILEKATVVYGVKNSLLNSAAYASITKEQSGSDTHQGLLLGYSEIEKPKPVGKKEILQVLKDLGEVDGIYFKELIKRIETNGIEG
jgi:hypothetical protein